MRLDDYQSRATQEQEGIILAHCKEHELKPVICAWYDDLEDFFDDWTAIGYSREEAQRLLEDNTEKEFITFPNGEMVRLEV